MQVVGYEEYSFCVGASSGGSAIRSMKLDEFVCNGGVHGLNVSSPLILDPVVYVHLW